MVVPSSTNRIVLPLAAVPAVAAVKTRSLLSPRIFGIAWAYASSTPLAVLPVAVLTVPSSLVVPPVLEAVNLVWKSAYPVQSVKLLSTLMIRWAVVAPLSILTISTSLPFQEGSASFPLTEPSSNVVDDNIVEGRAAAVGGNLVLIVAATWRRDGYRRAVAQITAASDIVLCNGCGIGSVAPCIVHRTDAVSCSPDGTGPSPCLTNFQLRYAPGSAWKHRFQG